MYVCVRGGAGVYKDRMYAWGGRWRTLSLKRLPPTLLIWRTCLRRPMPPPLVPGRGCPPHCAREGLSYKLPPPLCQGGLVSEGRCA